jgi:hypothetical protein
MFSNLVNGRFMKGSSGNLSRSLSLRASRKGGVAISVRKPLVCEPCWQKPISSPLLAVSMQGIGKIRWSIKCYEIISLFAKIER